MKHNVFFSVIVPTLNEEKYIPRLLRSLTKQTYNNFETIVVDGGSEDRTAAKVNQFSGKLPQLSFLVSDKRNAAHQRNAGALQARGTYYIFLDADVVVPPEYLEGIHYAIVSKKYTFMTTWCEPDSRVSSERMLVMFYNLYIEIAKSINLDFAGGWNTIIHRDIFRKVKGFNENLTAMDDNEFSRKVAEAGHEIAILKEPVLAYSLRRFRSEGTLQTLQKYVSLNMQFFLKGPIPKHLTNYQMGGHIHKEGRRSKWQLRRAEKYLKTLEKLQKKIYTLLME